MDVSPVGTRTGGGLRIVVACAWFLKYSAEQAAALAGYGHEVVLVHRNPLIEFGGSAEEMEACLTRAGDRGVIVRAIDGSNRAPRTALNAWRLGRWLRAWGPDAVHVHPNSDLWLLGLFSRGRWSRRSGLPLIVTVHDPAPHPGTPGLGAVRGFVDQAWLRRAHGFVVHGEELRRLWRPQAGNRPIWVVPHGMTVDEQPRPVPKTPCLLLFGRLMPYKGIGVLMRAMESVWASRPDVRVIVAGEGPSQAEVIAHPNVETHFRYVSEAELQSLLTRATLVVAPYVEASQSGVLSLAIGKGIPVVVSDAGALSDLALSSDAVAPAGDAGALAVAILDLIDHRADTRAEVLAMANSRFAWSATAATVTPFYEALAR